MSSNFKKNTFSKKINRESEECNEKDYVSVHKKRSLI